MYYIGIDLGGTNVAAGVTDREGRLLGKASIPCPRGPEAIADAMAEAARLAAHEAEIPLDQCGSVGVASPGTIDPVEGIVFHAFNLGLENVPLARSLYASTKLDREIPPELYGPVAEVLVYVLKLDQTAP